MNMITHSTRMTESECYMLLNLIRESTEHTVYLTGRELAHYTRATHARDSVNFHKFSPCMARARVDSLPGRCRRWFSVMRSKIQIRTSSCNKVWSALLHDEVRVWIFDDPAEQEPRQCPQFYFSQLNSTKFSMRSFPLPETLCKPQNNFSFLSANCYGYIDSTAGF